MAGVFDLLEPNRFEAGAEFTAQFVDREAPLIDEVFGCEFPVLNYHPAGQSDQYGRRH